MGVNVDFASIVNGNVAGCVEGDGAAEGGGGGVVCYCDGGGVGEGCDEGGEGGSYIISIYSLQT